MDIYSKDLGSVETLPDELLGNQSSDRRFFMNSMMKMDTVDSKEPTINCTGDINGRICTMMSSNMSNPAKDVSADHEPDNRNPYIRHHLSTWMPLANCFGPRKRKSQSDKGPTGALSN